MTEVFPPKKNRSKYFAQYRESNKETIRHYNNDYYWKNHAKIRARQNTYYVAARAKARPFL